MTIDIQETYKGFEVHSAAEARQWGYCLMLFSPPGGGKTTLAGAAADSPEDSPVLFIDAEGGVKAISHRPDVEVVTVSSWLEIKKITAELKRDAAPRWRTIVLDNLSEFIQLATIQIVGNNTDQTSLPKYGDMAREVLALVRDYRDIARIKGLNSIIIAWDEVEEDKAKRPLLTFNATPKLQSDLPGIVDIIGHIDKINGMPDRRILNFEPSNSTIAKFRRPVSDSANTIPHKIHYTLDNIPMGDILAALKRGKAFPVEKYPIPAVRSS